MYKTVAKVCKSHPKKFDPPNLKGSPLLLGLISMTRGVQPPTCGNCPQAQYCSSNFGIPAGVLDVAVADAGLVTLHCRACGRGKNRDMFGKFGPKLDRIP